MSDNDHENRTQGVDDMEFNNGTPAIQSSLNELDPRVQADLFERINRRIELEVRTRMAAFPSAGHNTAGTSGMFPPAGHSAASPSDQATDGRPMMADRSEVNFNWGCSLQSNDTSNQVEEVSTSDHNITNVNIKNNLTSCTPVTKANRCKSKRKRLRSESPVKNDCHKTEAIGSIKKRKLRGNSPDKKTLKQTNLKNYFQIINSPPTLSFDQANISHLVALQDESNTLGGNTIDTPAEASPAGHNPDINTHMQTHSDLSCTAPPGAQSPIYKHISDSHQGVPTWQSQVREEIKKTILREPILFGDLNPMEIVPILNENNETDQHKLSMLTHNMMIHNEKLFKLCMVRAKRQLYEEEKVKKESYDQTILKGISLESKLGNNNSKNFEGSSHIWKSGTATVKPNKKNDIHNSKNAFSLSQQTGEAAMTDGARSTWGRSRTVAVDAAKARMRTTFYKEAP